MNIWLQENTALKSSRYIGVSEKLAMFLSTIGHATTIRGVQERFPHSGETVSRCFHEVLQALVLMHARYVQLPSNTYVTDRRITEDTKYGPYFGDYLGALDAQLLYPTKIAYLIETERDFYLKMSIRQLHSTYDIVTYFQVGKDLLMMAVY